MDGSRHRFALVLILAGSFLLRLVHVTTPLLDGMAVKQVYVAHKARGIAGPPFAPLHNTFDFLTDDGRRLVLTEEVPLYTGLLALGYSAFGEREWLGRLLSSVAMLVATAALYDLMRRELGERLALPAALFFALSPLLLVYGQAVQPDACMLAGMLLAACCWSRHLETGRTRWWLAAAACGAVAALFKYYGLMVLGPLAWMQLRRDGWRAAVSPRLALLAAAMAAPVAAWMLLVFRHTPNPAKHSEYFIFQMPQLLAERTLYVRLLDRFLAKDCGPAMGGFVLLGLLVGRGRSRPLWGWTALAVGFYFLMGPLLRCHDYYEMMMMPAAAGWAALGWDALASQVGRWRPLAFAGSALVIAAVHSPWVTRGKFDHDPGYRIAADRLAAECSPGGRVVVVAPFGGVAVVHYARREGWTYFDAADLRGRLQRCRDQGAEYAVIYMNQEFTPAERAALSAAARELPVAEYQTWPGRKATRELYLIRLADLSGGGPHLANLVK